MKVAIYSGNIPSTTFIENLIKGLSESGFEILLFGKKTRSISYEGKVRMFPTPVKTWKQILFLTKESITLLLKSPKLFLKFIQAIKEKHKKLKLTLREAGVLLPVLNHPPDVFHIQWAKTIEQFPELFQLLNCKFAVSLRGAHINYSPLNDMDLADAYRKYFPVMDGFHSVSIALSKEAIKYGADKNKIKVIHSSVRDELLRNNSDLYTNDKTVELISIGRFHWKKGYHYALDAMNILSKEGIRFSYTIVAQGEIPEEIVFLINNYKLGDRVKIIKGLEYEKLISKLLQSHLLLLPSVEEGIANVVLEAMAVGVPVITTDCGGMSEVIEDKVNGYIIPAREPQLIASKIKDFILEDPERRKLIAAKAKDTIKNFFSTERQVKEFSNFYNSIVD